MSATVPTTVSATKSATVYVIYPNRQRVPPSLHLSLPPNLMSFEDESLCLMGLKTESATESVFESCESQGEVYKLLIGLQGYTMNLAIPTTDSKPFSGTVHLFILLGQRVES